MTTSRPPSFQNRNNARSGFTLLELIISLTIITMVVLVIYAAFAMGVRVWERQGQDTEEVRREEIMLRMLHDDFAAMAAYSTRLDGVDLSFLSGGGQTVFYATRNGFGAGRRGDKALFFACLFVHQELAGDGYSLYLLKYPEPNIRLLEALRDFMTAGEPARERYVPADDLRQEAVRIAGGFEQAGFTFSSIAYDPLAGQPEDAPAEQMITQDEGRLELEQWAEQGVPSQVQFSYAWPDQDLVHVYLVPNVLAP